jgi:hypothetical protein
VRDSHFVFFGHFESFQHALFSFCVVTVSKHGDRDTNWLVLICSLVVNKFRNPPG